jgi:hypothetical protein
VFKPDEFICWYDGLLLDYSVRQKLYGMQTAEYGMENTIRRDDGSGFAHRDRMDGEDVSHFRELYTDAALLRSLGSLCNEADHGESPNAVCVFDQEANRFKIVAGKDGIRSGCEITIKYTGRIEEPGVARASVYQHDDCGQTTGYVPADYPWSGDVEVESTVLTDSVTKGCKAGLAAVNETLMDCAVAPAASGGRPTVRSGAVRIAAEEPLTGKLLQQDAAGGWGFMTSGATLTKPVASAAISRKRAGKAGRSEPLGGRTAGVGVNNLVRGGHFSDWIVNIDKTCMAVDGEAGCQLSADSISLQAEGRVSAKDCDDLISERSGISSGAGNHVTMVPADNIVFSILRDVPSRWSPHTGATDKALGGGVTATTAPALRRAGLPGNANELTVKCNARLEVRSWMADISTGCKFLNSRDLRTAEHATCIDKGVDVGRVAVAGGNVVLMPCADGDQRTTV